MSRASLAREEVRAYVAAHPKTTTHAIAKALCIPTSTTRARVNRLLVERVLVRDDRDRLSVVPVPADDKPGLRLDGRPGTFARRNGDCALLARCETAWSVEHGTDQAMCPKGCKFYERAEPPLVQIKIASSLDLSRVRC